MSEDSLKQSFHRSHITWRMAWLSQFRPSPSLPGLLPVRETRPWPYPASGSCRSLQLSLDERAQPVFQDIQSLADSFAICDGHLGFRTPSAFHAKALPPRTLSPRFPALALLLQVRRIRCVRGNGKWKRSRQVAASLSNGPNAGSRSRMQSSSTRSCVFRKGEFRNAKKALAAFRLPAAVKQRPDGTGSLDGSKSLAEDRSIAASRNHFPPPTAASRSES